MIGEIRLDGIRMRPAELDPGSALSADTVFRFREEGDTVWADYDGGAIVRGLLAGTRTGAVLTFRYVQVSRDGRVDGGESRCEIGADAAGSPQLVENFRWATRDGSGRNLFVTCS